MRLIRDRRKKTLVDDVIRELDLIGGNQITFPELESPFSHRRLESNRSQNEAAIRLKIIVLKEILAALERKVSAVNEVFVKLVQLGVDVIDTVFILAIDDEQRVRQSVRSVGIVNDGKRVKIGLGVDHWK